MKKLLTFIVGCWVAVALFIQLSFVVLSFVNPNKADQLARQITWKLDGTFSN